MNQGKTDFPQVILGLAFGYRARGIGVSNLALNTALNISNAMHPHLPILVQSEFYPPMSAEWIPDLVVKENREAGRYLDTREVLVQMAEFCKKKNIQRAVIIAHPDHQWRVCRVAKKLGLDPILPRLGDLDVPYDPLSEQWWTNNRFLFWMREIPVIAYYWLRGWI